MLMDAQLEQVFIRKILNGDYASGEYLPPERKLAELYDASRPVVHRAMIRLESKGLITIVPRKGIRVNDFKMTSKLSVMESIFTMEMYDINPSLNRQMIEFVENLILLIFNTAFIPQTRIETDGVDWNGKLVFNWLQSYAVTLENPIYIMLLNEFEIGIVNAGNQVLNSDEGDTFLAIMRRIDFAMNEHQQNEALALVHEIFNMLKRIYPID